MSTEKLSLRDKCTHLSQCMLSCRQNSTSIFFSRIYIFLFMYVSSYLMCIKETFESYTSFCSANVRNRERSDPVRLCIRKREGGGTDHAFSSIFRGTRSRYREERVLANRPPYRRVERRRRRNPDCKGCPY